MALACTERVNKAVRMVIIFFIVVCFYVSNSCLYVERDACIIPLHREDTAFFYPAQQVFPNQGRENPYTSRGKRHRDHFQAPGQAAGAAMGGMGETPWIMVTIFYKPPGGNFPPQEAVITQLAAKGHATSYERQRN